MNALRSTKWHDKIIFALAIVCSSMLTFAAAVATKKDDISAFDQTRELMRFTSAIDPQPCADQVRRFLIASCKLGLVPMD